MPTQNVFGVYTEYPHLEGKKARKRRPWMAVTVLLAIALLRR